MSLGLGLGLFEAISVYMIKNKAILVIWVILHCKLYISKYK